MYIHVYAYVYEYIHIYTYMSIYTCMSIDMCADRYIGMPSGCTETAQYRLVEEYSFYHAWGSISFAVYSLVGPYI